MNKIDNAKLIASVTRGIGRVDFVAQDPPVAKAGLRALRDVRQAAKSCGQLANEVRSSLLRSADI
ncbi:hypothetical protein KG112_10575 [Nocardioides sp. zg-ZUI104]|uniref:hypothetical protein n=1 Tax=Nocardioides faecalis TaxID=2803858 RepID=UPI001BCAAF34|nr:hypothetical protein [Nocardioides faecalis]MBS4753245.1 hypothetical protein [Nocardioides faecalis]